MSEETVRRWLCHRCVKKENATTDIDPLLKVCDVCKIENWCRLTTEAVALETVEEAIVEEEELLEITGEPITEEEVEKQREKHVEDPYKGLTKAQLVELLKEKA